MTNEPKKAEGVKPRALKSFWIMVSANGSVAHWSLSGTKKGCINSLLQGGCVSWEAVKDTWKPTKVNLIIELA